MNKKNRITSVCSLALLCAMLSGCGVWQGMKDGTANAAKSIFYTKLKILKIDLVARNGLNQNERGQSLSTVVRIYQLKDKQTYEMTYVVSYNKDDKTKSSRFKFTVKKAKKAMYGYEVTKLPKESDYPG